MNILLLSDIHCQTFHKSHFLSKKITDTLYEYFDFGLKRDSFSTGQNSDTILILGGDVFNLAEIEHSVDKIDIELDSTAIMFVRFFEFIKGYSENRGLSITQVLFIEGNHEFWHAGFEENLYPLFERNVSTKFIEEVVSNTLNVPFSYLREKAFIVNNNAFVGNMLYNPCVNYETLLKGTFDSNINRMLYNLGDFNFLDKMLKDEIPKTSLKDIGFMNDVNLDGDEEIVKLKDLFAKKHHEIYLIIQRGNTENSKHNIAYYVFIYHFLTLIGQIITLKKNTETLHIITHFPFNYKSVGFQYNKDFTDISYEEFGQKHHVEDDITKYFKIDFSILGKLLQIIDQYLPNLKKIRLYHGHTHENFYLEATHLGKSFSVLSNSIGYGDEISKVASEKK